ncbi:MAG TPA: 5'-nucleotidase C-terminal domain-containing protein [Kofleriaceae bacterium]|nr:5'-nucleotidase C-terminal domain-containing protein [Kofleriaceae bacterium]
MSRSMMFVAALCVVACSQAPAKQPPGPRTPPKPNAGAVTITIVGTNDLHGALERLPILGGYVANLRAARAADGGGVILLDAGDMFQGTLESNLSEGADVVRAYNALGYTAAAVGNHEFDFGPVGPAVTAATIEDDARGALKARASEAKFPFVTANVIDTKSGARIKWPNISASTLVEVAGVKVGVIGASTESTPFTTMPANFAGLAISPPAQAIAEEAKRLREQGAQLIAVTAHMGSKCASLDTPTDTSSCDTSEELFRVIGDLPKGAVDVFVAGHTHAAIAHRIKDVAVIESYASGRAFGRIDLRVSPAGHVTAIKIHKPQRLCEGDEGSVPVSAADCKPSYYEGRPVIPDPDIKTIVDEAVAKASVRRSEKLGVTVTDTIGKSYALESAEGNLFTDLMIAARPEVQVALTNGGGLRADIPAGPLTYGKIFEAMPFDNRFAIVELEGAHLRKLVSTNLQRGGAILSWGGLRAKARCKGERLDLAITVGGKPLDDAKTYKLATSDFLASGGDGLIGRLKLPEGSVKLTDVIIRDAMVEVLKKRAGTIDPKDYFSPAKKRMDYEGERPVTCAKPGSTKRDREPEE